MRMVVNNKRKISALLCAVMIQFSLYGITERQAKMGAIFVGLAGGSAFVGKNADSGAFIAGACIAACTYYYLKKYTAAFKLAARNAKIDMIQETPYAKCWINGKDTVAFDTELLTMSKMSPPSPEKHDEFIFAVKSRSDGNGAYKLAIEYEKMKPLFLYVNEDAQTELEAIKNDAIADGILADWQKTENRRQHTLYGLRKTDCWISTYPSFKEESEKYEASKNNKAKLDINKANAIANAQAADAANRTAQAVEKDVNRKWWKDALTLLFGIKLS